MPDTSIYEYAKQGLALSADKPAIWFYGKSMTYAKLFYRIDNVADHLAALGVGQGTVVTIHLPNCPQAAMAIYAVAKLGGICNMVHPQVPLEGLRENMTFTESNILITGDHFPQCGEVDFAGKMIFASLAAHMGTAYGLAYRLKNGVKRPHRALPFKKLERPTPIPADIPKQSSLAEKCAVYLHSSGTTETPKTVMHCHRALNCWEVDVDAYYEHEPQAGRVMYCALPLFHGAGLVLNMHHCMVSKMEQVMVARFSAPEAVQLIRRKKVEVMTGTPALYKKLLMEKRFCRKNAPKLEECFISGDTVPQELKVQFDLRLDPSGNKHFLYEGYGLTEAVTAVCSNGKRHYNPEASGYPLPGCRAAVLRNGRVFAEGEGELLLDVNTRMMGYLGKDDMSTFFLNKGIQWLRTGDWGMVDKEGFVYCIDRIKNLIIHNGYNIFPSQVEDVICALAEVKEVCVVGVADEAQATQTVRACVVLCEDADPKQAENHILSACAQVLPRYAIPRQFRYLRELPRNRMAKIDRKALEELP